MIVTETRKTEDIIDRLCALDMAKKALDNDIKKLQAELQTLGLNFLEDRNIKRTEFYGSNNNIADITYAQKLDIINYGQLNKIGGDIVREYVKPKEEIKYDVNARFKDVLIAIFNNDYDMDITVEDILDRNFELDPAQKKLLLKKLRGEYKKDKANILAVIGKKENEADIEVELDFIYRAKNWEKIKMFFPDDTEEIIQRIKKFIIVEATPKIGIKYDTDESED